MIISPQLVMNRIIAVEIVKEKPDWLNLKGRKLKRNWEEHPVLPTPVAVAFAHS